MPVVLIMHYIRRSSCKDIFFSCVIDTNKIVNPLLFRVMLLFMSRRRKVSLSYLPDGLMNGAVTSIITCVLLVVSLQEA